MPLPLAWLFLLNQLATYWAPGGSDGFGGVLFTATPTLVRCRWQNVQQLFRSSTGEEHTSNAVIWPEMELLEKGYVALGDHVSVLNPRTLTGTAWEIRGANWSPAVRGDRQMNKVFV